MRGNEESEPGVLFKSSHILREEILRKTVDHAQQPMLEDFSLRKCTTRGITSLGHYMMSMRLLRLATYKRGDTLAWATGTRVGAGQSCHCIIYI